MRMWARTIFDVSLDHRWTAPRSATALAFAAPVAVLLGCSSGVGATPSVHDTGLPDASTLRDSGLTDAMREPDAADAAPLPPSCAPGGPGMTNCGATKESCCASLPVPSGTYDRAYVNEGGGAQNGSDPATVSGLNVDKYLVTVGRFRQFASVWDGGAGWAPAAGAGKHLHLNGGQGLVNAADAGAAYESGWNVADDSNIAPGDLACDAAFATWTPAAGSHENLPINCVNWFEAYAFCIWDGGFLPSEAE